MKKKNDKDQITEKERNICRSFTCEFFTRLTSIKRKREAIKGKANRGPEYPIKKIKAPNPNKKSRYLETMTNRRVLTRNIIKMREKSISMVIGK